MPMKVVVLAMKVLKVTLPMLIVMTVGLGMRTVPIMLVPSGSGVSSMENSVTLKPASPLSPNSYCQKVMAAQAQMAIPFIVAVLS